MSGTGLPDDVHPTVDATADREPTPPARPPRAGRNLGAAIAVGCVLGAAILVSLFTVRQIYVGIVAAAVAVASWELAGALRRGSEIKLALVPVLLGGQAIVWLSWPYGREGVLIAFVLTVLACLVWRFVGGSAGYLRDVTASVFIVAYLPMLASFAAMLVVPPDGTARVVCFMLAVIGSDTGGYVAGVLGGRHKMAPTISPKKTWEGFGGSLVTAIAVSALTLTLLLDGRLWHGVLFGAAIVGTATVGDLIVSLIKRDLGLKDMGNLLPGHGGLMDRMDSLLPSAVVSWLLLTLFVPPA